MGESRNQTAVERRMKEAVKVDRARIQLGRISQFGLMELSRQRLRPSVFETSTVICPSCEGSGRIRSTESSALQVLRAIEEEGVRQRASRITVRLPSATGFYILNSKRVALTGIEERYGFEALLEPDEALLSAEYRIEVLEPKAAGDRLAQFSSAPVSAEEEPRSGGRRRRRPDRRRTETEVQAEHEAAQPDPAADDGAEDGEAGRKRRRRGKRGGRRRGRRGDAELESGQEGLQAADQATGQPDPDATADQPAAGDADQPAGEPPAPRRRRSRRRSPSRTAAVTEASEDPAAGSDRAAAPTDDAGARADGDDGPDAKAGTDAPTPAVTVEPQGNGAAEGPEPEPGTMAGPPGGDPVAAAHAGETPGAADTRKGPGDAGRDTQAAPDGDAAPDAGTASEVETDPGTESAPGTVPEPESPPDAGETTPDDSQPAVPGLVVEIMSDVGVVRVEGDTPPEAPAAALAVPDAGQPPRRGWWNRPEG